MTALELANQLRARFAGAISEPVEFRGEITLTVSDAERMPELCAHAKTELGFDYLLDISSLDNYGDDPRFTLVYHLYGYGHRVRIVGFPDRKTDDPGPRLPHRLVHYSDLH